MKGLLLKDLYQIRAYSKNILLIAVVMLLVGGIALKEDSSFFLLYGGLLFGMLPMTMLSYDQTSGWNEYAGGLPVSREQVVGSKYLLGLFCCGSSVMLAAAAVLATGVLPGVVSVGGMLSLLVQVAVASLMGTTLMLPLTYRFGVEKARMVYLVFIGAFTAMGMVLLNSGALEKLQMPTALTGLTLLASVAVMVVLYAASWRLSVLWYGHKEEWKAPSRKPGDPHGHAALLHILGFL